MSTGKTHTEWDKKNTVMLSLKFTKSTDADIIDYLNRHGKQPEIKRLIRKAIEEEKQEENSTPFDY